jgi:hypothetical protein
MTKMYLASSNTFLIKVIKGSMNAASRRRINNDSKIYVLMMTKCTRHQATH